MPFQRLQISLCLRAKDLRPREAVAKGTQRWLVYVWDDAKASKSGRALFTISLEGKKGTETFLKYLRSVQLNERAEGKHSHVCAVCGCLKNKLGRSW